MKAVGIDGKIRSWNLTGYEIDDSKNCSKLHDAARKLLRTIFTLDCILEEVPLPGSGGLKADLFIPRLKMMIEVQGEQHYRFKTFFHQTKAKFVEAIKRDQKKANWCELNQITLVVLPYDRTDDWRSLIIQGISGKRDDPTGPAGPTNRVGEAGTEGRHVPS